ncbi:MAG: CRISPR-associated endonuclease Cas3'', partial [Syntrophobacteraceae bacterium]
RTTHRLLVEKHRSRAILLTGRMRPFDKDDTLAGKLAGLSADFSSTRQLDSQLFVVATQTLEVGANLDFDMLVTECASLDALRQRFGRLNRIGRKIESRAAILIRADQAKGSDDDPVYGPALASTWHWLKGQANERDEIDMGISSLSARLNGEEAPLNAPTNHAPVMLPAHIDRWAQTAPEPFPTPDISLFLHGPGRVSADVQVCWRADIDLNFPESAMETLAICPPAVGECLPVPIGFFRRWLQGDDPSATSVTDVEGTAEEEAEQPAKSPGAQARRVLRWCGREDALILSEAQNLKPGDVVVIPLVLGGWNSMGDLLQEEGLPVADWGDRAYVSARAKSLLRLHPAVVSQWPDFRSKQALLELAGQAKMLFEEDPDEFLTRLRELLKNIIMDETAHGPMKWMKLVAESITGESGMIRKIMLHPSGEGVILRGTQQLHQQEGDSFSDEDDSSASGTTTIGLSSHLHGVSDFSAEFGALCDLPSPLIEAISCAGLLHDTGKADARFQSLLRKSSPWLRGELLAKSDAMPQGWAAYRRACKIANYPVGGRHEMLSARLAENAIELLPGNVDLQELVLHLVASHHGHCRPFAPVVRDSDPIEVVLEFENLRLAHSSRTGMERIDSGAAERFWSLTRRYGWWGLAYLEAILRLADHRRSEWEEANHDKNGSNGN